MNDRQTNKPEIQSADRRGAYWLQQYAAAFAAGDKRSAAVALNWARQYNAAAQAQQKQQQLG